MSEILKTMWARLYAWALPSALFLGAASLFVLPQLTGCVTLSKLLSEDQGLAFLGLTGALAISLPSLSTRLYRFLEGYSWLSWAQKWGIERQRGRKKELQKMISQEISPVKWRQGIAIENISRYPFDDRQIAPTRFGNAIRAYETYGKTRFNMNSQTLWHELFAVATKHIQSEIESAKSSVDFFIASFYLSIFFGFACWVLAGIQDFKPSISALSIPAFALAGLCHSLAIRATDGLIYPVQALVNLGRVKLADNLGLRLPKTLEAEKTMWGLVTRYAYHADKSYGNDLDVYRKPFTEARAEERFVMCERWPRHLRCRRP